MRRSPQAPITRCRLPPALRPPVNLSRVSFQLMVLIGTLLLQGAAGAFLVFSHYGLSSELLHAGLTGVVFTAAAYLCLRVTVAARGEERAPWSERRRSRLRPEGVR